mgnify:CR=1 FL=1
MRLLILLLAVVMAGCAQTAQQTEGIQETEVVSLKLTSSAFEDQGIMPSYYTCDGKDISPPLAIDGVPEGANVKSHRRP